MARQMRGINKGLLETIACVRKPLCVTFHVQVPVVVRLVFKCVTLCLSRHWTLPRTLCSLFCCSRPDQTQLNYCLSNQKRLRFQTVSMDTGVSSYNFLPHSPITRSHTADHNRGVKGCKVFNCL